VSEPATLGAARTGVNGLALRVEKDTVRWDSPGIESSVRNGPTNGAVRRWMGRVILEVLAPMHEGYPILEACFERQE